MPRRSTPLSLPTVLSVARQYLLGPNLKRHQLSDEEKELLLSPLNPPVFANLLPLQIEQTTEEQKSDVDPAETDEAEGTAAEQAPAPSAAEAQAQSGAEVSGPADMEMDE